MTRAPSREELDDNKTFGYFQASVTSMGAKHGSIQVTYNR